jgi:hypothetical protein
MAETVRMLAALGFVGGVMAGVVALIRSRWRTLRALGWAMLLVVVLLVGLVLLTLGSGSAPFNPPDFIPQEKWPDGGLEVALADGPQPGSRGGGRPGLG